MAGEKSSPMDTQAQLRYEMAVYHEQISMLRRETERVSLTTIDLSNALTSVDALSKDPMLVPVGGGVLVRGVISATNVLMPVGAGYLVEMKKEGASLELSRRIDATKKAVEKLTEEFNKINSRLREISHQVENLSVQSKISQQADDNIREDYL